MQLTENTMAPVQPGERIDEIDIVRGLALFGILMVNMSFFKYPVFFERYPSNIPAGIDQIAAWIIQLLFTGKFYAIFSFLFGLGFYIFMERTLKKGLDLVPLYRRRLLALLVFGLLHLVLLWTGDILFTYALTGFIVLRFRNKSIEAIGKWIAGLLILSVILHALFGLVAGFGEMMAGDKYSLIMAEMIESSIVVYTEGSFFQLVVFRAANELPYVLISLIVAIPAVLAFFLCGLYAGKKGIFTDLPGHAQLLKKIRNLGLPTGALLLFLYILFESGLWPVNALYRPTLLSVSNYAASIFIFPAYVATILLALQAEFCKKFLAPVAAAGRMALTNYLTQTIICILIFNGYGLGLYNKISVTQGVMIALTIYLVQVAWSNLWLSKFRYGPMEWFWRLLTYKKRQSFFIGK